MPSAEHEYKDRLFSFIFGQADHKDWTLSLYNAVNGSSYDNPDDLTFTTIREALYLGMRNDVSFLIANEMNMYEQQSSYCPNMPLRMLQYSASMYEKYVTAQNRNKYGRRLINLPVPRLVVFYNGLEDQPDDALLRLTDAFDPDRRDDADKGGARAHGEYQREEKRESGSGLPAAGRIFVHCGSDQDTREDLGP